MGQEGGHGTISAALNAAAQPEGPPESSALGSLRHGRNIEISAAAELGLACRLSQARSR